MSSSFVVVVKNAGALISFRSFPLQNAATKKRSMAMRITFAWTDNYNNITCNIYIYKFQKRIVAKLHHPLILPLEGFASKKPRISFPCCSIASSTNLLGGSLIGKVFPNRISVSNITASDFYKIEKTKQMAEIYTFDAD